MEHFQRQVMVAGTDGLEVQTLDDYWVCVGECLQPYRPEEPVWYG
jgi:hypothetical protein